MALYLVSKIRRNFAYEVISFDKAKNLAVLRDTSGAVMTDINFHISIIKRCYTLTDVRPKNFGVSK